MTYTHRMRGVPHPHLVFRFDGASPDESGQPDDCFWAEISSADLNSSKSRQDALELMIHCTCPPNMTPSPFMKNGRNRPGVEVCGKKYPQPWRLSQQSTTKLAETSTEGVKQEGDKFSYTRQVTGKFFEGLADNSWVDPCNIWLLSKYNSPWCFDICTKNAVVQYLFQCINKGFDFIKAKILRDGEQIEACCSARYIFASEPTWRPFGFHTMQRRPALSSLHVHLPGDQHVAVGAGLSRAE